MLASSPTVRFTSGRAELVIERARKELYFRARARTTRTYDARRRLRRRVASRRVAPANRRTRPLVRRLVQSRLVLPFLA